MKEIQSENLRNVAVVGHGHSGKTSLVSALLFNTKMVNRLGKVDQGNTVTDFDEEEIARKISIQASLAYAYKDKIKINLLDTPGFANFVWETMVALRAVETGVMVVSRPGRRPGADRKDLRRHERHRASRCFSSSTR